MFFLCNSAAQRQILEALYPYVSLKLQHYLSYAHDLNIIKEPEEKLSHDRLLEACRVHQYSSEIISLDPLVIYINNFASEQETEELIEIGYDVRIISTIL